MKITHKMSAGAMAGFGDMPRGPNLNLLNIDQQLTQNIQKNPKICSILGSIFGRCHIEDPVPRSKGNLLYKLATESDSLTDDQRAFVGEYVNSGRIASKHQLHKAIDYFSKEKITDIDVSDFEEAVGVGVEVADDQIECYVRQFVQEKLSAHELPWNHPTLLTQLKQGLANSNYGKLFEFYCRQAKEAGALESAVAPVPPKKTDKGLDCALELNKLVARGLDSSLNTRELIQRRQLRAPCDIITRFPPEPNGYLHIGHCKAMNFNFSVAKGHHGITYLRYDDSNPAKESEEFIREIENDVRWMGFEPAKVTFASDYFDVILDLARQLIDSGRAFVCRLTKEESKTYRDRKQASPYRNTSVEENREWFEAMVRGELAENQAVLRAKIDPAHANPAMRDPPIYRIKAHHHPRTGNTYSVYPLYDFVHPICDSLEDISHSLCTLEFENRRELYYWFLDALGMFKPHVWEYSRLNITYNVLSKRKITAMIEAGLVEGWDDPRLLTIKGLRRRGVPSEAILKFCDQISVARRGNDVSVEDHLLEKCIRDVLFPKCRKAFGVLEPVAVRITNLEKTGRQLEVPSTFSHPLTLESQIFIDACDLNCPEEGFKIQPGKVFRLKYGPQLRLTSMAPAQNGNELVLEAEVVPDSCVVTSKKTPKVVHWLPESQAVRVQVNCFDRLFNTPNPGDQSSNFMDDFNPQSKKTHSDALVHQSTFSLFQLGQETLQFERLGYFCADIPLVSPSPNTPLTLNRVVALKSDIKKQV